MADIYIIKEKKAKNIYGEQQGEMEYEGVLFQPCVGHYPNTSKDSIIDLGQAPSNIESIRQLEIVWLKVCKPTCEFDIVEGYYVYFMNKYWKLIGLRLYDNCKYYDIKLTLERLVPREHSRKLIECVSCFDFSQYFTKEVCYNDYL